MTDTTQVDGLQIVFVLGEGRTTKQTFWSNLKVNNFLGQWHIQILTNRSDQVEEQGGKFGRKRIGGYVLQINQHWCDDSCGISKSGFFSFTWMYLHILTLNQRLEKIAKDFKF